MKLGELLDHWQKPSNDDRIDIYTSDKTHEVHLLSGIYNELPYAKMKYYIDCEVISFSFTCDLREQSGIIDPIDPLSSPYKVNKILFVRINEIGAVRLIDN